MSTVFNAIDNVGRQTTVRGLIKLAQAPQVGNRPEHPFLPSRALAYYTGFATASFIYRLAERCYLEWKALLESQAPPIAAIAIADAEINEGTGVITVAAGHGLRDNQIVHVTTSGSLPTELTANTPYWVDFVSPTTFKLATTFDGTGIAAYSAGTWQINLQQSFIWPVSATFAGLGDNVRTMLLREIEWHVNQQAARAGAAGGAAAPGPEWSYLMWSEAAIQNGWKHRDWGVVGQPAPVDTAGKLHPFIGAWEVMPREMQLRWRVVHAVLYGGLMQMADTADPPDKGVAGVFGPPNDGGSLPGIDPGAGPGTGDDLVVHRAPRTPYGQFYKIDGGLRAGMIIL